MLTIMANIGLDFSSQLRTLFGLSKLLKLTLEEKNSVVVYHQRVFISRNQWSVTNELRENKQQTTRKSENKNYPGFLTLVRMFSS